jgi:hypothetical protein
LGSHSSDWIEVCSAGRGGLSRAGRAGRAQQGGAGGAGGARQRTRMAKLGWRLGLGVGRRLGLGLGSGRTRMAEIS